MCLIAPSCCAICVACPLAKSHFLRDVIAPAREHARAVARPRATQHRRLVLRRRLRHRLPIVRHLIAIHLHRVPTPRVVSSVPVVRSFARSRLRSRSPSPRAFTHVSVPRRRHQKIPRRRPRQRAYPIVRRIRHQKVPVRVRRRLLSPRHRVRATIPSRRASSRVVASSVDPRASVDPRSSRDGRSFVVARARVASPSRARIHPSARIHSFVRARIARARRSSAFAFIPRSHAFARASIRDARRRR